MTPKLVLVCFCAHTFYHLTMEYVPSGMLNIHILKSFFFMRAMMGLDNLAKELSLRGIEVVGTLKQVKWF